MAESLSGAFVECAVSDALRRAQLSDLRQKFVFELQVRRLDHLLNLTDKELIGVGVPKTSIKRLRQETNSVRQEISRTGSPVNEYVQNTEDSVAKQRSFIPKEQIKVYELLGEGSFAVVKRGIWQQNDGTKCDVAVKILRDMSPTVLEDLKAEASHLLKLQHPHLIRMYGIVQEPSMLVFELCEGGSLLDRLRDDHKPVPLVTVLLQYCEQVAKALQFLEHKHCVHRDVAARNILLTKDEKLVKICDFGLMRNLKENEQMYIMAPQKKVPFAWCPPEALKHRKFSHASDVWSFGVTTWEVFSLGEEPWIGCRAIDVLKHVSAGEKLEQPKYCSKKIYDIMASCWQINPDDRPKFGDIRESIKNAAFNTAVLRENYNLAMPEALAAKVNDTIIVIDDKNVAWFGQHTTSRQFGYFPGNRVFVENSATTVAITSPTQKTSTPVKFPSAPLPTIEVSRDVGGSSRISLPVRGSFIHTGHGDVLGGQSWGDPGLIAPVYLKNPVAGQPMSSSAAGAVKVATKAQAFSNLPSTSAAHDGHMPLEVAYDWEDDFEQAQSEGFSPSNIELPRHGYFNERDNNVSVVMDNDIGIRLSEQKPFASSVLTSPTVKKPSSPMNLSSQYTPKSVLITPGSIGAVETVLPSKFGRPVDDIRLPLHNVQLRPVQPETQAQMTLPSAENQRTRFTSVGVPTYRMDDASQVKYLAELQSKLHQTLAEQISRPRPASTLGILQPERPVILPTIGSSAGLAHGVNLNPIGSSAIRPGSAVGLPTNPSQFPTLRPTECLVPTMLLQPTPSPISVLSSPATNQHSIRNGHSSVDIGQKPHVDPNAHRNPITTVPVSAQPTHSATPIPVEHRTVQATNATPSQSSTRPTTTSTQLPSASQPKPPPTASAPKSAPPTKRVDDAEERRSKIASEISKALPPPSELLTGPALMRTREPLKTSTTQPTKTTTAVQPTKPVEPPPQSQVRKEPDLSLSNVLQPTRLPTNLPHGPHPSSSVAKPIHPSSSSTSLPSQQQQQQQQSRATPVQTTPYPPAPVQTQVPLYNLSQSMTCAPQYNYNSSLVPYANGMNGYGYNTYNGYNGYSGYTANSNNYSTYNYPSNYFMPSSNYPPLVDSSASQSQNVAPLGEADIHEFLGVRQSAASAQQQPRTNMAQEMEELYKKASFSTPSAVEKMVIRCNGNTEAALHQLQELRLVELGLAKDHSVAAAALQKHNFDLNAAADALLN